MLVFSPKEKNTDNIRMFAIINYVCVQVIL